MFYFGESNGWPAGQQTLTSDSNCFLNLAYTPGRLTQTSQIYSRTLTALLHSAAALSSPSAVEADANNITPTSNLQRSTAAPVTPPVTHSTPNWSQELS